MTDTRRFVLGPGIMLQGSGDEALLMNLNDETMFTLNDTALRVVQLLLDERTVAETVGVLSDEFTGTAGDLGGDVTVLVDDLLNRGLISEHRPGE